jgi:hypothetical protein
VFAIHLDDFEVAVCVGVVVDRALLALVPAEHDEVEVLGGGDEVAGVELVGLE